MKKHQLFGFNYITNLSDSTNVLTGNSEEADHEEVIPCFNGIAFFKANGNYFKMRYKKIQQLDSSDKGKIEDYCGYEPSAGEYGVIAMTFGVAKAISEDEYNKLMVEYPVTQREQEIIKYGLC